MDLASAVRSLGIGQLPGDNNEHTQSNASPAGLAVTRDDGAHWKVVKPSGVTWNPTDHSDYVDPDTAKAKQEEKLVTLGVGVKTNESVI